MDLDDGLGLSQPVGKALVLASQPFDFSRERIVAFAFAAAFLGPQRIAQSLLPLSPPGGQVRGVEFFSALQLAQLSGPGAAIGFFEDAPLVRLIEAPSRRLFRDFHVRGTSVEPLLSLPSVILYLLALDSNR